MAADHPSAQEACGTCRTNRGELRAPGGVLYEDALWRIEHLLEPVPFAGWFVLKPLRHVEAFSQLTLGEAASFGPLVRRIAAAVEAVLAPAKLYVCLRLIVPRLRAIVEREGNLRHPKDNGCFVADV